jgi:DNA-directed RNA polymerase sigma subunit (sigma70/sigma32)
MAQSDHFHDGWLDLMNSFWGNLWKITTCDSAWCDSKKVINRIRFTLKKRIFDREVKQRGYIKFEEVPEDLDAADKRLRELNLLAKATPRSLDAPIGDDASMTLADMIPARADNENFVWLRKLVDDDANSELKEMVMGIQPDLNAQNTLQLFLDGHSWRDIAKQFGVNEQTFNSFVNRRCLKLLKRLWDESEKLRDEETLKKIQEESQANSETL